MIEDWLYEGPSIPAESTDMKLNINLWLMSGLPPINGQEAELVVSDVIITLGIFIEPPDLQISRTDTGQILLSWNEVPNALSYVVLEADAPLPVGDPGWIELEATSLTSILLEPGAEKKFCCVKAVRE